MNGHSLVRSILSVALAAHFVMLPALAPAEETVRVGGRDFVNKGLVYCSCSASSDSNR